MQTGVQVIKTVPITYSNLVNTNIPDNDYTAYSPSTTYANTDRVVLSNEIWESLADANTGNQPDTSPDWWYKIGPINRWKAFDLSSTTKTIVDSDGWYELKPNQAISHVVFLGLVGTVSIRVRLITPSSGTVFDVTKPTGTTISESNWWAWTFEPRIVVEEAIFAGLPARPDATVRIDFSGGSGSAVGVITYGSQRSIGTGLKYGASIGIQDFSRKERNDYGDTFLVQRAFAKEASFNVDVPNEDITNVYTMLAGLRATPCLWIGYEPMKLTTVWGFYRSFNINIAYPTFSEVSIEIEGLT